jgi:hypothetical protein
MYIWRIRLILRRYPAFQEELWCVQRDLWLRRVLNAPGIEEGGAAYYELAKGITFLKLAMKRITYPVGGPYNIRYPYSIQEKKALHARYTEIVREYESVCKTRRKLIGLHPLDRVRAMIEEGFAKLQIPSYIIDRLLDNSCKPPERSPRPLALEHAAKDALKDYEPWKHKEDELLYLEREGKKLSKHKEDSGGEIQT